MRKLLITFVLILFEVSPGSAQDRIVTWNNDTVNCKIIRNKRRIVDFQMNTGGIITYGKLRHDGIRQLVINNVPHNLSPGESFSKWMLNISGGPSFLTAGTAREKELLMEQGLSRRQADRFYEQIMYGYQCTSGLNYFLSSSFAAGLSYRFFRSSARVWATVDPHDEIHLYYGRMSQKHYTQYASVSALYQPHLTPGKKLRLALTATAGILFYRDEESLLETNLLITGKSAAFSGGMGFDYFIRRRLSAGLNGTFFYGRLRKLKTDDGSGSTTVTPGKTDRPDLSAVDLSAGVKFYF